MFRLLEIFLSSFALIILSPLLICISLILRFTGEREVFYKQIRAGYKSERFKIYKFVTMMKDSPNIGAGTLTMKNDPRVLPVGVFLRKTKINELPQLINILIGDMGIVGPRPLVPEGEQNYSHEQAKIIRSVRPGLTGMGSLMLRDEESYYAHRSDAKDFYINVISPYKASLEIWYVQNISFNLNIKIIIGTIITVFAPAWNPIKFFTNLPKMPQVLIESKLENSAAATRAK
jgi:lipopolysaccharide/colanic/teichoic acid biosynthesis glycosyltransferase|tara:strand:+ start:330 stop:1025 length:696 start_codon:yes stop_codon:yes gene_type:complete